MEAYFQAVAIAVGGTALVGSCLLTRWLVADRFTPSGIFTFAAPIAVIALIVFGGRMSAWVSNSVMSLGFSSLAAALTSVAVLCVVSGFVFAFVTGAKKQP